MRPGSLFVQVACFLWLIILFRVLGSTAENFFSPILTQLSQEMGLPPRFAGGKIVALLSSDLLDYVLINNLHKYPSSSQQIDTLVLHCNKYPALQQVSASSIVRQQMVWTVCQQQTWPCMHSARRWHLCTFASMICVDRWHTLMESVS